MTMDGWVWLIVGIVGLLLVGGAYLIVRDWHESKTQRGQQEYQSPEPLPPTPTPSLPPAESRIQWGEQLPYQETPLPSGLERIQWGNVQNQERIELSPIIGASQTDDESVKCPICRLEIEETTEQVIKCPGCESMYHQNCLAEMDSVCRNCGKELS